MRIAIVGSRDYLNMEEVIAFVDTLAMDDIVITGGARGVDIVAETAARKRGLEVVVFLADWDQYGKAAGYMRNQQLVDDCDTLVAFWDGTSNGTRDSISKATKAGKLKHVFRDNSTAQGNLF